MNVILIFLYETGSIQWIFSRHWILTAWCFSIKASAATCWVCINVFPVVYGLTHWGRVTHICVSKLTIIGSDNGLSPGRRQAIIWTNGGILLIRPLGTNFSEILSEIHTFSFKKMHLKTSSAKWRPFCLGLNVLRNIMLQWSVLLWCSTVWLMTYIRCTMMLDSMTYDLYSMYWQLVPPIFFGIYK